MFARRSKSSIPCRAEILPAGDTVFFYDLVYAAFSPIFSFVLATSGLSIYSSKVMSRSITPCGVSSIMRFTTVLTNSWSWEVNNNTSLKLIRLSFNAVMDSRSRWLVGSSKTRTLHYASIILDSMQRTFSPPDRISVVLRASSPEKSIRPRKVLAKLSPSLGGAY